MSRSIGFNFAITCMHAFKVLQRPLRIRLEARRCSDGFRGAIGVIARAARCPEGTFVPSLCRSDERSCHLPDARHVRPGSIPRRL